MRKILGLYSVDVISSDPPFKECHVRFATVPYQPLSDQEWII